jgi:hypothetical protein
MDQIAFPWRPLGTLLVDEGLLEATELELALEEQRRTGRLLGQILVGAGYVSAFSLAQALAKQHGVEVRPTDGRETPGAPSADDHGGAWQPLGTLLRAKGFVSEKELEHALAEQAQTHGRRLGEILVERGYLSGAALALALAEQHGVALGTEQDLDGHVETIIRPAAPGEPTYHVFEVEYEPAYRAGSILYRSTNFLEAADFACEFVARSNPQALEIQKLHRGASETVWTYSESRAAAAESEQKRLVETFGFDPTRWDPGSRLGRA